MKKLNSYRDGGAIGALLDEYEKAINELIHTNSSISAFELKTTIDKNKDNPDCKSIQAILSHVIKAGQWYTVEIRNALGEELPNPISVELKTSKEYQVALSAIIKLTEQIFIDYPEIDIYTKRNFRWKQITNIDILLEHAIVHVLRHRRQIDQIKLQMNKSF